MRGVFVLVVAPTAPTKPISPTAPTMSSTTAGSSSEVHSSKHPASTTAIAENPVNSAMQVSDRSPSGKIAVDQVDKSREQSSSTVFDSQEGSTAKTVIPSNQLKPATKNSSSGYISFLIVVVVIAVILVGWRGLKIIAKKVNITDNHQRIATKNDESASEMKRTVSTPAYKGNNFDFRA